MYTLSSHNSSPILPPRYVAEDLSWASLAASENGANASTLRALLARLVDLLHQVCVRVCVIVCVV